MENGKTGTAETAINSFAKSKASFYIPLGGLLAYIKHVQMCNMCLELNL